MIDTLIIGAGPSGLCAAKTILQCDPNADVTIIDSGSTIGGVWAKEKLYPTLKTNHYFGGMDFSDFQMPQGQGAVPNDHMSGIAVHEFLKSYARHFRLEDRIQLHTTVTDVSRLESGGWRLTISTPTHGILECRKLIIGMGVNNRPYRPQFAGATDFHAPILHSTELGPNVDGLLYNGSVKRIAVLGGGKSAYDAVHMASSAGKEVDWIIRKSGKGPVWVFPMETKMGPFKVLRDKLPVRRFVTFFSPCIWNDGFKWLRNMIHGTKIGQYIKSIFWAKLHAATVQDCGYRKDPRTKMLEPQQSPFWYGTTGGSCKYLPELFENIRNGRVRVHREDISHLSDHAICLTNGRKLEVDAIITATGFSAKPTMNFVPTQSHSNLGIPTTELDTNQQKFWANLDLRSDMKIAQQLPDLNVGSPTGSTIENVRSSDHITDAEARYSPFRLYRSLAPPGLTAEGDRSLVFLGVFSNFANHARLEIQCLWAYAYLNNKLAIDSATVYEEVSMLSRYSKHRTPMGHGSYFPDHVFDQLPYFDTLMRDLGLNTFRKSNWFRELFAPYDVTDYKGIVQEWLTKGEKRGIVFH